MLGKAKRKGDRNNRKDSRSLRVFGVVPIGVRSKYWNEVYIEGTNCIEIGYMGGKLIVVNVTVKNNDKESRMVDGSMFTIVDNQGRKFSTLDNFELATILEDEYILLDSINPGMSLTGTFVFEVPSDIEDYTLRVASGVGFTFGIYETINLK